MALLKVVFACGATNLLEQEKTPAVLANEKVTSIGMEEIKECAHEGHVTFEPMEKIPKN